MIFPLISCTNPVRFKIFILEDHCIEEEIIKYSKGRAWLLYFFKIKLPT